MGVARGSRGWHQRGEFCLARAYGLHQVDLSVKSTVERASRLRQEIMRRLTDLQALRLVKKGERDGRAYTWNATTEGLLRLSLIRGGKPAAGFGWSAGKGESCE